MKGSKRARIYDYMKKMRNQFRAALKDNDLQEAFDELWPTWSSEMALIKAPLILSDLLCEFMETNYVKCIKNC